MAAQGLLLAGVGLWHLDSLDEEYLVEELVDSVSSLFAFGVPLVGEAAGMLADAICHHNCGW